MHNLSVLSECSHKEKKLFKRNLLIGAGVFLITVITFVILINLPDKNTSINMQSSVEQISELATYRAYYHNVAAIEEDGTDFLGFGYKKYWIEYTGEVEMGVDLDNLYIGDPQKDGTVDVYLPEAKIFNATPDIDSISKPITEKALFVDISADEESKLFNLTQEQMLENAAKDIYLLAQAKEKAKIIIESYIRTIGEDMGKEYSINWLQSHPYGDAKVTDTQ